MLQSIGRLGSKVLDKLVPTTRALACTDGWCETNASGQKRCCKQCPSGKICATWGSGCPGGCLGF